MHTDRDYFNHYLQASAQPLPQMQEYFLREREYLLELVAPQEAILDVGCGSGRNIKDLAPHVRLAVGVDSDAEMIEAARVHLAGLHNVELYNEDFFAMTFPEQFDLTLCTYNTIGSPFIHAFKREAFVRKMMETTKPGGNVIITFWKQDTTGMEFSKMYFSSIGVPVLKVEKAHVETTEGIFRRFSREDIEIIAKQLSSSYSIVDLTDIFFLLDITIEKRHQ